MEALKVNMFAAFECICETVKFSYNSHNERKELVVWSQKLQDRVQVVPYSNCVI